MPELKPTPKSENLLKAEALLIQSRNLLAKQTSTLFNLRAQNLKNILDQEDIFRNFCREEEKKRSWTQWAFRQPVLTPEYTQASQSLIQFEQAKQEITQTYLDKARELDTQFLAKSLLSKFIQLPENTNISEALKPIITTHMAFMEQSIDEYTNNMRYSFDFNSKQFEQEQIAQYKNFLKNNNLISSIISQEFAEFQTYNTPEFTKLIEEFTASHAKYMFLDINNRLFRDDTGYTEFFETDLNIAKQHKQDLLEKIRFFNILVNKGINPEDINIPTIPPKTVNAYHANAQEFFEKFPGSYMLPEPEMQKFLDELFLIDYRIDIFKKEHKDPFDSTKTDINNLNGKKFQLHRNIEASIESATSTYKMPKKHKQEAKDSELVGGFAVKKQTDRQRAIAAAVTFFENTLGTHDLPQSTRRTFFNQLCLLEEKILKYPENSENTTKKDALLTELNKAIQDKQLTAAPKIKTHKKFQNNINKLLNNLLDKPDGKQLIDKLLSDYSTTKKISKASIGSILRYAFKHKSEATFLIREAWSYFVTNRNNPKKQAEKQQLAIQALKIYTKDNSIVLKNFLQSTAGNTAFTSVIRALLNSDRQDLHKPIMDATLLLAKVLEKNSDNIFNIANCLENTLSQDAHVRNSASKELLKNIFEIIKQPDFMQYITDHTDDIAYSLKLTFTKTTSTPTKDSLLDQLLNKSLRDEVGKMITLSMHLLNGISPEKTGSVIQELYSLFLKDSPSTDYIPLTILLLENIQNNTEFKNYCAQNPELLKHITTVLLANKELKATLEPYKATLDNTANIIGILQNPNAILDAIKDLKTNTSILKVSISTVFKILINPNARSAVTQALIVPTVINKFKNLLTFGAAKDAATPATISTTIATQTQAPPTTPIPPKSPPAQT